MCEKGLFGQDIFNSDVSFVKAMDFFKDTAKTEGAFFIRFEEMPLDLLECLSPNFSHAL